MAIWPAGTYRKKAIGELAKTYQSLPNDHMMKEKLILEIERIIEAERIDEKSYSDQKVMAALPGISGGLVGGVGVVLGPQTEAALASNKPSPEELRKMIMSRMRGHLAVDYYYAYQLNAEKTVCFIIKNEQATIIEDDASLFPSDAFITKLRLLLG